MRRRWLVLSLLSVLAASAALADGPETGVIAGVVTDASGSPLPGVRVTLEGERAAQVAVTGEDGKYVFGLVPPGSYRMTAALEGFGSQEQAVNVTAGSRADFAMELGLATAEQITVMAEAPLVDKYNVTAGAVMQGETAGEISATVRTFYGALQALPGVTNDVESTDLSSSRPGVNGALWQESNVYIDGVDATFSMMGGGTQVFLPSSALTEVNMEAGGGGAEYGRNVGSHTNLIVKSGANRFHGDFNGVYSNMAWNENYDPQPALAEDQRFVNTFIDQGFTQAEGEELAANFIVWGPGEREGDEVNLEASIGGPIKRDKAWFFVSYGDVSTDQLDKTLDGEIFNVSTEVFAAIAKVNVQPAAAHSLAYTFIDSPVDRNFLLPQMGDRYAAFFFDIFGGVNSLSYNWSASSNLFLEVKLARQDSGFDTSRPFGPDVKAQAADRMANPALGSFSPNNNDAVYVQSFDNTWHNGWISDQGIGSSDYPRDQFNAALTQFAGASHELKYGLDLQRVEWDQDVYRPNLFSGYDFQPGTTFGFANGCYGAAVDPTAQGRDTRCVFIDFNGHGLTKGSGDSDGSNSGAYVRDRMTFGEHWTLTTGLRYEDQSLDNDRGRTVIDQGTLSPRLSVVYDVAGNGTQLVTFNTGRFFVQTPQLLVNFNLQEDWTGLNANDLLLWGGNLVSPALSPEQNCAILDSIPSLVIDQSRNPYCFVLGSVRPGLLWQYADQGLIDVDIEPYHRDEAVLGYEWQFSQNWALDAKAIWWRADDLIGSTLQRGPNFELFLLVENYGDYADILRNLGWVDNFVARGIGSAAQAEAILSGLQDDNRDYRGLQLQLNRRFSEGWALYNNVTFSSVEGRTYGGGSGANDTGAFSNINDDYARDLEAILTEGMIAAWNATPDFCSGQGLPSSCISDLRRFIGTPLSTMNRQGELPVDRPIILKSYGYRQWELGSEGRQTFNLGGLFVWQSGSPWERTLGTTNPNVSLLDSALNSSSGQIDTFLTPRGHFENEDFYWLNLTGAWGFPIKGAVTGQLRLEVANVTDEQEQVTTSNRTGAPLRSRRSFQQPRKYRLVGSVRF